MTAVATSCPCNAAQYCQGTSTCEACTVCDADEYAWRPCTETADQRCAAKPRGFFVKFEGVIGNGTGTPTRAAATPLYSAFKLTPENCASYCASVLPSCDGFEIATDPSDADQATVDCLFFNALGADSSGQPSTKYTLTFQLGEVPFRYF